MSGTSVNSGGDGMAPLDVVVSVVVLFVLAVAQPLLDLLGRNAEFFLARSAPPIDIVLLAVLLTFVIPIGVGIFIVWVRSIHELTGRIAHGGVLAFLAGVLALQIIELTPLAGIPPVVEVLLALGIGVLMAVGIYKLEPMRTGARFASVAPFVVLALFVFGSSVSQLVFATSAVAQPVAIPVDNPAPVVFIIFDEFPVASLMDGEGNLQEELYPSFAKLAKDGSWFPNAITVQQQTENSVPVILSGKRTSGDKIPVAGDHPFTLFTLLDDAYDLRVIETVTDLCPEYACENATRPQEPFPTRWSTLIGDLQVIAGHLFLPSDMADELAPIDSSWTNFSGANADDFNIIDRFLEATDNGGRVASINQFLNSMSPAPQEPTLYYMHALLPHVPWEFLSSGQRSISSSVAPGSVSPGWGSDEWLVDQGYQRHLLQVGYVDTILGDIIEQLEKQGFYDDSLIVVLADHGVTVRPDIYHRRHATEETIGDIAAIPLFIKRPNDKGGVIDRYRVETIDVLPTVADVLGIDVPWAVDGVSLFSGQRPERTESSIEGSDGVITFGVDGSEALGVAARKTDHFGSDGPYGLAPDGYADLLGVETAGLTIVSDDDFASARTSEGIYTNVDLDAPALPTWYRGALRIPDDQYQHWIVALAVNGRIAAVTRTYLSDTGNTAFGMMIPPSALVEGPNTIEVLLVQGTGTTRTFTTLSN
jgi:hypothetical protein